jgi:transglutaminase-like putative cysteine protease
MTFRQSIHIGFLLGLAFYIYGFCQQETLLPMIAGGVLVVSFLLRLRSTDTRFKALESIPLVVMIITSLGLGFFYRSAFPAPKEALSLFPGLTATAQSASIFAAVLFWLKPLTRNNLYMLLFLAWLTVTLSINIPPSPELFFDLSLFCLLSLIVIFLHTLSRPTDKKHIFKYYRDFVLYSAILIAGTTALFFGISRGVMLLDNAYMNAVYDYFLPRGYTNFLNMDPKLNLISPGNSAFDKRPVFEVSFPHAQEVYLKTQVFRDFNNGTWQEFKDPQRKPVSATPGPEDTKVVLTMFTPLADIIPSPPRLGAVQGRGVYEKDVNLIVYEKEMRRMRVVDLFIHPSGTPVRLEAPNILEYKKIPDDIAQRLKDISSGIVGTETDEFKKVVRIQDFFSTGFKYSLDVNYRANNEGLIEMIEQHKPAYCTYFATAMCLLLRSQGIPARVATGFYTTELIDPKNNTFLARVKNAHAWVQVLLVMKTDPFSGDNVYVWANFDPTPPGVAGVGREAAGFDLEKYFEIFWLAVLRTAADLQNLDKDKAKMYVLYALLGVLFLTNAKGIFRGLRNILTGTRLKTAAFKPSPELQLIYRKYEQYLLKNFSETRRPTETDRDVVLRLKERPGLTPESIATVENFLKHYHAARFGDKQTARLEELLK